MQYDYIAHFHTKELQDINSLPLWFSNNMDLLFGTSSKITQILELLNNDAKMVYSEIFLI